MRGWQQTLRMDFRDLCRLTGVAVVVNEISRCLHTYHKILHESFPDEA